MDEDTAIDDNEHTGVYTQEDFDDGDEEKIDINSDNNAATVLAKESNNRGDGDNSIDINGNDGDNEDDDDRSSVGSFSSSQSGSSLSSMGSEASEASLTLMQRQARNVVRNERFLGSLREKYKDHIGTQKQHPPPNSKGTVASRKRKTAKENEINTASDMNEEHDFKLRAENLGMVMKGTHRLFRFSPARGISAAEPTNGTPDNLKSSKNDEDGAFLRACENYASGIQTLERRYPHRRVQIGKLHSLLSSTVSLTASTPPAIISSSASSVYVPAPIFCIGSKGTGKTSIVCDAVGLLSSQESIHPSLAFSNQPAAKVQPAYVDCSIVEPSTIERLVYTIYKQLKPSSSSSIPEEKPSRKPKNRSKPKHKKKRNHPGASFHSAPKSPQDGNDEQDANRPPPTKPQNPLKEKEVGTSNQPRVLPSRRAKKAAIHKSLANKATTYKNVRKNRVEDDDDSNEDDDDSDDEAVTTMHSAVLSLGRSLQKQYGSYVDDNGAYRNKGFRKKPKCGILVLDKAEELLSLSSASKKGIAATSSGGGVNNYLSELLLLPKIMKLNLTIVVVTNYCTLHMTRLNNSADPSKALGTISNGVHPIIVQFPAYKGNKVFSEILSTSENQNLVMGDSLTSPSAAVSSMRQSLKDKLVRSFWNTVVQFASDSTRDVRDFQRLGRALWPSFVAPLHPSVLKTTLEAAANKLGIEDRGLTRAVLSDPLQYSRIEDEVVRLLGNKFYPRVAALASGDDSLTLLTLDEDGILPVVPSSSPTDNSGGRIVHDPSLGATVSVPQPYLRSCLLLAAFVCQHNKADRDRKLFSIHGNGRRRKSKAKEDIYGGNDEDLAFGSTNVTSSNSRGNKRQQPHQVEQLRSLKLRPIPLERIFSIFVTLVRLNPSNIGGANDDAFGGDNEAEVEATMDDLGSSRLYTDLSHLIDIGYLHLVKGSQPVHLAPSRILCSLTREEALEISHRIGIPLERYLL